MKIYISMMIYLAVFLVANQALGDGPIGLLLDGYQEGCTVKQRDGATHKCRYKHELYAGDSITKTPDASALKIQWLAPPYTKADRVKNTLNIVSIRPEAKNVLIAKLTDFLPFLRATPHHTTIFATRGEDSTESCRDIIIPMPGYGATLLPGLRARFTWYGKGKSILFRGEDGKVVYRASVEGKSEVPLTPEEIGLKQGITYTWEIEGIYTDKLYQVRLIGKEIGDMVQRDLAEINGFKSIEENEKAIRMAAYLQMTSELYPKEADLYWLSMQLLGGECQDMAGS